MKSTERAQAKIIRVLTLLDRMVGFYLPKTVTQLQHELSDSYRCKRTLYRDIELLIELGMVVEAGSVRNHGRGPEQTLYEANVPRSKRLQLMAAQKFVRSVYQ